MEEKKKVERVVDVKDLRDFLEKHDGWQPSGANAAASFNVHVFNPKISIGF